MNSAKLPKISIVTATIVGINAMIGAGIFGVPAALACSVGPAGILTYTFVIFAVWCMARAMARLAQLYPTEGSFYTYASQWGGHKVGLIAAGTYLFGLSIAMGLLVQMAGNYLHAWLPSIGSHTLSLLILACLALLNIVGANLSSAGQMVLVICTVFPLIAITSMCFAHANFAHLTPFMPYGFGNLLAATRAVIFGFFGFECAASLFAIVENPEKNVAKALTYSITIVGLLYLLFVTGLILAVPLHLFSDPSVPLSQTLAIVFPTIPWIINIIHFCILSAVIGTLHSMIWSASALLIAYTKKISNTTFSHRTSILCLATLIAIASTFLKNIDLFFSVTGLCIITAFILSMVSLLFIKEEWKSGRNLVTIAALSTAFLMLYFAAEGLVQALL